MTDAGSQLKIMNILDPLQCLRCRCARVANVLFTDGETKKMFYCSRLDCDNWSGEGRGDNGEDFRIEDSEAA